MRTESGYLGTSLQYFKLFSQQDLWRARLGRDHARLWASPGPPASRASCPAIPPSVSPVSLVYDDARPARRSHLGRAPAGAAGGGRPGCCRCLCARVPVCGGGGCCCGGNGGCGGWERNAFRGGPPGACTPAATPLLPPPRAALHHPARRLPCAALRRFRATAGGAHPQLRRRLLRPPPLRLLRPPPPPPLQVRASRSLAPRRRSLRSRAPTTVAPAVSAPSAFLCGLCRSCRPGVGST